MATNIIEAIQQNLEYPVIQKIDPNIQETKNKVEQVPREKLAQAAIPAVLAGIYRLSRTEEGAGKIIRNQNSSLWLNLLYSGKEHEAIQKVARYAGVNDSQAGIQMEAVATEAVFLIKKNIGKDVTEAKVKTYMNGERHHILVYLPAALAIGDLLNDESLDDRTNKMEGPISNLVHKIENNFSGGDR